jgi:uncharacterized membrane protein YgcG
VGNKIGRAIGGVLLTGGVLFPAATAAVQSPQAPTYEETSISSYDASFTLDRDGTLRVVEDLAVDFPYGGKHGIFRFFDSQDHSAPETRRIPRDFEATMDGSPEEFVETGDERPRYRVYRIGSADRTLDPGTHRYRLTYTIDGALEPGTTGRASQFYWNLVPGGWQQQISNVRLRVFLPAPGEDVQCAVGAGSTTGCEVEGEGTDELTLTISELPSMTPVTLKTGIDVPTPKQQTLPWAPAWDGVLGTSLWGALWVSLAALIAGAIGGLMSRSTREPTPPYPLMYAPPDGLGPAQGAYVLNEKVDDNALSATLLHAAERASGSLQATPGGWRFEVNPQGLAELDPVTHSTVAGLVDGSGSFEASKGSVGDGKTLQSTIGDLDSSIKKWAIESGTMSRSGIGCFGMLVFGVTMLATPILIFTNPFHMSLTALIPGLFVVGVLGAFGTGATTKRTPAGRDLWARLGGFRRVLSTPSSKDRFDFSGREELYTAYLPWAVAFGVADKWAAKYRAETGKEPPVPGSLGGGGYTGTNPGGYVDQVLRDFRATTSGAISAYAATQRSSSSSGGGGGGGFSGGGGGGGGGGGSW